jgi:hypothetical protein
MAQAPPQEIVDELYGAPLDEFTALRDERAKELRKEDRAAADAVKRLRKPSVSAWAVNQLSRRSSDDLEALLGAGEALRQAQLGGGDRDAIRAAASDEREAVERLVGSAEEALREAGRGATPAALEEVRETLHAAASDDETRELVRGGTLTEGRQAVGLGGFGAAFAAAGGGRSAKPASTEKADKGKSKPAAAATDREAEAERKRAARERVKAARTALRDAEREAKAADRATGAAERDRDAARRALDEAEAALDRARSEAEAAHDEAERRREELEEAESA